MSSRDKDLKLPWLPDQGWQIYLKSLHGVAVRSFCAPLVMEGFMARFLKRFDKPVAHAEMFLHWDENPVLERTGLVDKL